MIEMCGKNCLDVFWTWWCRCIWTMVKQSNALNWPLCTTQMILISSLSIAWKMSPPTDNKSEHITLAQYINLTRTLDVPRTSIKKHNQRTATIKWKNSAYIIIFRATWKRVRKNNTKLSKQIHFMIYIRIKNYWNLKWKKEQSERVGHKALGTSVTMAWWSIQILMGRVRVSCICVV